MAGELVATGGIAAADMDIWNVGVWLLLLGSVIAGEEGPPKPGGYVGFLWQDGGVGAWWVECREQWDGV